MQYVSYLIKEALAKVDVDLELATRLAQAKQEQAARRVAQLKRLDELGQIARTHPAWHAALTGGIGAVAGAVPGVLLGGWKGGLLGAGLGAGAGGWYGAGRDERARELLKEIHKGAPVSDAASTNEMQAMAGGLLRAR